ncbi:MAG: multidrug transporter subunit MdtN [Rhizobiales bacterium]|nr:multidrug transporter subunit MdtN [Hyphomicrobiales bacterium]
MAERPKHGRIRTAGIVVSLVAVGGAAFLGWRFLARADSNPLSQDAVLTAAIVNISSAVPGRIAEIGVRENQSVRKGEVLFALDPTTYRLAVDQAAADLKVAEASYADARRAVSAETSNAVIAEDQITRAQSNLDLATQTLSRLEALRPKGYVSAQQVDDAMTAKRDAEVSLSQALKQREAADALVSDAAAAAALVEARKAALAIAEQGLIDTVVRAPFDGKVAGLQVTTGEYVLPGQAVFTLIDTSAWFASATFLETELPSIEAGDCATVYALADRTRAISGRVEGSGWGVLSEDLIDVPRSLPLVPKNLDWVRIAQRFPVRIHLLEPPEALMRIGASATAIVHHGPDC